ncbi:MAG: formate/nitrite transporter family protein [Oscillospiraceae bacterium]|jgi:formate/nitrite transporter FocA (FNT family)
MRRILNVFLKAVPAGMLIAVGGVLYLSVDNKYIGSFLFGIGLFLIFSYQFFLFTGKVGYAVENGPRYWADLGVIWLGNLAGALLTGFGVLATRIAPISEKAAELCAAKLGDHLLSIFILSMFCGMLMFVAADNYKNRKSSLQKHLAIFLPVMVFILCGFEHCVANMFYFTAGQAWGPKTAGYLVVMSLGNAAGAFVIPLLKKAVRGTEPEGEA